MSEKILFVTKGGDGCDEGFPYALELAKSINSDIAVMIAADKGMLLDYEEIMTSIAFAEEGDHNTIRGLLENHKRQAVEAVKRILIEVKDTHAGRDLRLSFRVSDSDVVSGIKDFIKDNSTIDMVLLSPALTRKKGGIDIKKMIKSVSKPIVTINRPLEA